MSESNSTRHTSTTASNYTGVVFKNDTQRLREIFNRRGASTNKQFLNTLSFEGPPYPSIIGSSSLGTQNVVSPHTISRSEPTPGPFDSRDQSGDAASGGDSFFGNIPEGEALEEIEEEDKSPESSPLSFGHLQYPSGSETEDRSTPTHTLPQSQTFDSLAPGLEATSDAGDDQEPVTTPSAQTPPHEPQPTQGSTRGGSEIIPEERKVGHGPSLSVQTTRTLSSAASSPELQATEKEQEIPPETPSTQQDILATKANFPPFATTTAPSGTTEPSATSLSGSNPHNFLFSTAIPSPQTGEDTETILGDSGDQAAKTFGGEFPSPDVDTSLQSGLDIPPNTNLTSPSTKGKGKRRKRNYWKDKTRKKGTEEQERPDVNVSLVGTSQSTRFLGQLDASNSSSPSILGGSTIVPKAEMGTEVQSSETGQNTNTNKAGKTKPRKQKPKKKRNTKDEQIDSDDEIMNAAIQWNAEQPTSSSSAQRLTSTHVPPTSTQVGPARRTIGSLQRILTWSRNTSANLPAANDTNSTAYVEGEFHVRILCSRLGSIPDSTLDNSQVVLAQRFRGVLGESRFNAIVEEMQANPLLNSPAREVRVWLGPYLEKRTRNNVPDHVYKTITDSVIENLDRGASVEEASKTAVKFSVATKIAPRSCLSRFISIGWNVGILLDQARGNVTSATLLLDKMRHDDTMPTGLDRLTELMAGSSASGAHSESQDQSLHHVKLFVASHAFLVPELTQEPGFRDIMARHGRGRMTEMITAVRKNSVWGQSYTETYRRLNNYSLSDPTNTTVSVSAEDMNTLAPPLLRLLDGKADDIVPAIQALYSELPQVSDGAGQLVGDQLFALLNTLRCDLRIEKRDQLVESIGAPEPSIPSAAQTLD
ncbi:hypothetical protein BCR39DRAFT_590897 [Naematelia encephala]|uniref:Uncharacterized protein n=1 Tax=Naematelia encephala TaxID=71784 RepID=A0A1Y2AN10_9TREE|nr:hypothetical protein BCR39DRAFT_590897 [Naematelia encephala]